MGVINQLPTDISDKIAAGEVVENPASVVKELVENSIDAGAGAITVEIENGGTSFIRVSDNGCGMAEEDAKMCFLRHATSKIHTAADLDAIYTLGFRGEAMSSIGAVCRLEMFTKRAGDEMGTRILFEGGKLSECETCGAADGTVIVVKELFYNTPARLKFLKKDAAEAGRVADIMVRFILAHPEISFRFVKNGKEVYASAGDNSLANALYAVYGREYARAVCDVDYEYEHIRVRGLCGKSETARARRDYQSFFVNSRYIQSAAVSRAVEEAYKNQVMINKYPTVVLDIEIDPAEMDINVHPTKLEVKFAREQDVYRAVYYAVKNAIYALPNVPEIERVRESEPEEAPAPPREAFSWEEIKKPAQRGGFVGYEGRTGFAAPPKNTQPERREVPPVRETAAPVRDFDFTPPPAAKDVPYKAKTGDELFRLRGEDMSPASGTVREMKSEQQKIGGIEALPRNFRIIGQLFNTYILAEENNELLLVDQHAAHERLKYEELKKELEGRSITPQVLMLPVPLELSPREDAICAQHIEDMARLGFEIEKENGGWLIKSVPSPMDEEELCNMAVELLTALDEGRQDVITDEKQRLIYTIACKAAIKANHRLGTVEMYELVRRVFSLENINTCPHGRPIIIKMTKKEIEKEFGRTL